MVTLTNTLSGKKETFRSLQPDRVTLYACGITPYDRAHIGHARSYVSFDLLYRWLIFLGYDVTYCRNFTDIDDKLLKKAQSVLGDQMRYPEIAEKIIAQYQNEMKALNCVSPYYEPRVTDHIPLIITFIEKLIEKGHAYESDGDVYFSIDSFPEYGKLSKQRVDELCTGARVQPGEKKYDPLDFALWKKESEGTFWKSPWGWGRPGWHIECSALASYYLGDQIDIHGGGRDLLFPHHENEVAQSESLTGKPFAQFWIHNGLMRLDAEKMSKSLGNIIAIEDILKQYDPMELRFYFLQHHYHSPMEFSFSDLDGACKSYRRLCRALHDVAIGTFSKEHLEALPITARMLAFLKDDLNSAGLLGVVFENLDTLKENQALASAVKQIVHNILGLRLQIVPEKEQAITPEIQKLIDEREAARAQKDWARADAIRDQLTQMGYEVRDRK
ncbi:MAG: hypothetical protein ACD_64C00300G0001 [uncultured bacterium]|nr:MAG: hypothetical protein ACD_64C00300G0001 [uncultured bacterium]